MLNKNVFLLLEDFSDYNRFPKFQQIDDRLHVNERFSIIIDHRNNTNRDSIKLTVIVNLSATMDIHLIDMPTSHGV